MVFRNMKRMMSDEEAFATILGILLGTAGGALGSLIGIGLGPLNVFCGIPTWFGGWFVAHVCAGIGVSIGIIADVLVPVLVPVLAVVAAIVAVFHLMLSMCFGCIGMPFIGTMPALIGGK